MSESAENIAELKKSIKEQLAVIAKVHELSLPESSPQSVFKTLIRSLSEKYNQKVVILIDEYDKPILDSLSDLKYADRVRKALIGFYGAIKPSDEYLRFVFITGVAKFTKTSIFSDLNLADISLSPRYADICGITHEEFDRYLSGAVSRLSADLYLAEKTVRDAVFQKYDGYSWNGKTRLFNPWSLISFFNNEGIFNNYWYESGSPSFLFDLIKKDPHAFAAGKEYMITADSWNTSDITSLNLIPVMFMTGYLTAADATRDLSGQKFRLDMPNDEVRHSFYGQLLSQLGKLEPIESRSILADMSGAPDTGNPDRLKSILARLFSSIPYNLHTASESYYHSIFHSVLLAHGSHVLTEVRVAQGCVDAVFLTHATSRFPEGIVYITEWKYGKLTGKEKRETIENKLKRLTKAALAQIENKGYAKPYEGGPRPVIRLGVAVVGHDNVAVERAG